MHEGIVDTARQRIGLPRHSHVTPVVEVQFHLVGQQSPYPDVEFPISDEQGPFNVLLDDERASIEMVRFTFEGLDIGPAFIVLGLTRVIAAIVGVLPRVSILTAGLGFLFLGNKVCSPRRLRILLSFLQNLFDVLGFPAVH